jgi:hypothetical protein
VSLAGAGDLNGEGFPDFTVGANGADPASVTDAGAATVFSYAGIPAGSSTFGSGCPGQGGYVPAILTGGGVPTSAGNPSFRILLARARPLPPSPSRPDSPPPTGEPPRSPSISAPTACRPARSS